MRAILESRTVRSALALAIVLAALLSEPKSASGQLPGCGVLCGWNCPSDPWGWCNDAFGGTCGMGALCGSGSPCGWMEVKLQCYGYES